MKLIGLKRARESRDWTQERLAKELGVHTISVARWEAGTRIPNADTIRRLAQVLRVTTDELLDATLEQGELPRTASSELAAPARRRRRQAPAPDSTAAALASQQRASRRGVA